MSNFNNHIRLFYLSRSVARVRPLVGNPAEQALPSLFFMVRHTTLIQLAIFLVLSSCSAQKKIPDHITEEFTYCYDGKNTGINSLLKTDGYYVIAESFKDIGYKSNNDTAYFNILFYENGICVFNFFPLDSNGQVTDNKNIPSYFNTIIDDGESKEAYYFFNAPKWGKYIIEGDTIKAQCIDRPRSGETSKIWTINEVWYKIIDKTTIIKIASKSPSEKTISIENRRNLPAQFVAVTQKPKPNCWLIKEDWFWCRGFK